MKHSRWFCLVALAVLSLASTRAQSNTPKIVETAQAFLNTLDAKQRQTVQFAFDDDQ